MPFNENRPGQLHDSLKKMMCLAETRCLSFLGTVMWHAVVFCSEPVEGNTESGSICHHGRPSYCEEYY